MKRKRFLMVASILVGALLLICLGSALVFLIQESDKGVARERNYALSAQLGERIQLGMTRKEVELQIDGDAKKRYQCSSEDVYLIGSSDPSVAAILYLKYRDVANGEQVLDGIAGLDQDMLFSYERCPTNLN